MNSSRRQFLKASLAGGILAQSVLGAASCAGRTEPQRSPEREAMMKGADGMPARLLGRTGQSVTILGLGCAYAGGGVDGATTRATIETALDEGVRYFDSAPEYVQAEERLGPVIASVRDAVFLTTKTYAQDAGQAEKDLARALKNLCTDHVDLFLQHGVGLDSVSDPGKILGKGGSLEFLREAKRQGRARFIGMSVHAPHRVAMTLLDRSDEWEVVMPFINYVARVQERGPAPEEDLLARVEKQGLGIVAMKVLGGSPGLLADNYDRAFRFALSVPGVACALIGVTNADQVRRAVQAAREFRPMTAEEMAETLAMGEKLVNDGAPEAAVLAWHRHKGSQGIQPA